MTPPVLPFGPQLQMLGYDISWAAFNIIEVMSASKFTFKVRAALPEPRPCSRPRPRPAP